MKTHRYSLALMVLLLASCASLGVPSPTTFNQRALLAKESVAGAVALSTTLLNAHKISSADSENVQKQADNAMEAVNIASSIRSTAPGASEEKLQSAETILKALQAYLKARQS